MEDVSHSLHYIIQIVFFFISMFYDLGSVVAEPVVGLSEVVKDDAAPVASTGRQDN